MAENTATKKGLILAALAIVVLAMIVWQILRRVPQARVRELANATITKLDPAKGVAEIEFVHPKSGREMKLTGSLAENCQIFINDQPATFAELRVGDKISVRGMVHPDYSVEAEWVRVTRPASPTQPSPTTAQAAAGP